MSPPPRAYKSGRKAYTDEERREIVEALVKKRAYNMVKVSSAWPSFILAILHPGHPGHPSSWPRASFILSQGNAVWKTLDQEGLCRDSRTWQSMKEQFRKVIPVLC